MVGVSTLAPMSRVGRSTVERVGEMAEGERC